MPLSAAQLARVRPVSGGLDYTPLTWTRDDVVAAALLVHRRRGGLLLCVPPGAVSDEELTQAEAEGFWGTLGPHARLSVPEALPADEGSLLEAALVEVVLLDVNTAGVRNELGLHSGAEDLITLMFETEVLDASWPAPGALWVAARSWLEQGNNEGCNFSPGGRV